MNRITITIIVTSILFSCCKSKREYPSIPSFKGNISLRDGNFIKKITDGKDFAVAYEVYSDMQATSVQSIKAFCLKDSVWEKIELVRGISEVDSILSHAEITVPTNIRGVDTTYIGPTLDIVEKEVLLKKQCRKEEAHFFFNQLVKIGLFKLGEEAGLLEKCKLSREDHNVPEPRDAGRVTFYIIIGNEVKILNYDIYQLQQYCPTLQNDVANIQRIQDLFEKEWYVKKHY